MLVISFTHLLAASVVSCVCFNLQTQNNCHCSFSDGVLVVNCEKGPKPAFLKDGNLDKFFVRGGNARLGVDLRPNCYRRIESEVLGNGNLRDLSGVPSVHRSDASGLTSRLG